MQSLVETKSRARRLRKSAAVFFAALALVAHPTSSSAEGFSYLEKRLNPVTSLPTFGKDIVVHPFQNDIVPLLKTKTFGLLRIGQTSLDASVKDLLRDQFLHPFVEVRGSEGQSSFALTTGLESRDYGFYVRGVPLCGFYIRAHRLPGDEMVVVGRMPEVDAFEPSPDVEWPDLGMTVQRVTEALATDGIHGNETRLVNHAKCYHAANGSLLPVWDMVLRVGDLPYAALSDANEVFSLDARFFDVQGSARVYEKNPTNGTLKDFTFELTGDSTLSSEFVKTSSIGVERASNASHQFNYSANDPRFQEASVFSHIIAQHEYFKSIGYVWVGPKPLNAVLHAVMGQSVNNALFQPSDATDSGLPTISVGDGDGRVLQNLPVDSDVVAHEFGHHVIFRSLKVTSGESLVLHEGLADFFAFSNSGDACLGESICPAGSSACAIATKCLRSAENTIKYKDGTYLGLAPHLKGQLVSGFLWDLRKSGAVPANDLAVMANKAIDFLARGSDIRDYIIALITADRALSQSKYGEKILEAARARGMSELVAGINLNADLPAINGEDPALQAPPATESKSKKDSKILPFCAVPMGAASANTALAALLLLVLPAILASVTKKLAKVRVRRR